MMISLLRLRNSLQDVARLCKWAGAFVLISAVGLAIWHAIDPIAGYSPTVELKVYHFWNRFIKKGQFGILFNLLGEIVRLFQSPIASSTDATIANASSQPVAPENSEGTSAAKHNVVFEDLTKFFVNLWNDPVRLGYWSGAFILLGEIGLAIWAAVSPVAVFTRDTDIGNRLQILWVYSVNGLLWGLVILTMARIVDLVQRSRGSRPST